MANSWKHGDRCIAGINPQTGKWVRPTSSLPDGRVPKEMRQINRREPALLDLLEIPLAETGEDFGFESENQDILPGKWRKIGHVTPQEASQYCSQDPDILHNDHRYVTVDWLQSLPVERRITLQLVKAVKLSVRAKGERFAGSEKWVGDLVTDKGKRLTATITDPIFTRRLELGYRPEQPCLVTVSLSMPWRPDDWEGGDPCWKLIAAVIELPHRDDRAHTVPEKSDWTDADLDDLPF